MIEYSESWFMPDASPDEIRAIGRAKHVELPTDVLEAIVIQMLEDVRTGVLSEDLRVKGDVDGEEFNVFPLFAGAAFEVLLDKLMNEQNG